MVMVMQKSCGGFIALLLVIALILSLPNLPDYRHESPQIVCGDSFSQSEAQEDSENNTSQFIVFVVIAIIVIFTLYCITGTDNQSHGWR